MKFIFLVFFILIAGVGIGYLSMSYYDKHIRGDVLSDKTNSEININPMPIPSPTLIPTLTPTPEPSYTPTPQPTPTVKPSVKKYSSMEIQAFKERFTSQYGVDINVLRHIAVCESGFNPLAVNGVYAGLFQFSSGTWKRYRQEIGENKSSDLRLDAEEAVQTAAYVLSKNQAYIWPNCTP